MSLREEVYELEVLELGGEGGGELRPVLSLAQSARYLQERGDGPASGRVPALQGDDRARHPRVLFDGDQGQVPRRDAPHDRRSRQERDPQPVLDLRMPHRPREPEVHILLQCHLQDVLRGPRAYGYRHPRIRRREPLPQPWQSVRPYPRRRPEHEPPSRSPTQLSQPSPALLEAPPSPLRVRQELLSRLREPHPPARPHEELVPNLHLQRLQTRRQGRLRQEHLLRSPAQVSQARHRQEALYLSEKHAVSLRSPACQHVPFGDFRHALASPPLSAISFLTEMLKGAARRRAESGARRAKRAYGLCHNFLLYL